MGTTKLYATEYTQKNIIRLKDGRKIEQIVRWFNQVAVGATSSTNVIRFEEIEYNADGSIATDRKGNKKRFKTEWISLERIHTGNCFNLVKFGGMRANHEDLHNTLKNRGYAAKHDYARANPTACLIWKMAMFVAFFIFELFSFTKLAKEARGTGSWRALARELFADLLKIPCELITLSPSLRKERIQFRFDFSP